MKYTDFYKHTQIFFMTSRNRDFFWNVLYTLNNLTFANKLHHKFVLHIRHTAIKAAVTQIILCKYKLEHVSVL